MFSHLANVHRLLISGQIKAIDLGPLRYWLEKLGSYPYGYGIKPPNEVFQPYVRYPDFGYVGIVELANP
jgi:hypothetical protein